MGWLSQGYRIWNFAVLRRGLRLGFRPLWLSLGRRDALVRRKLGRRGSYAIALGGRGFGLYRRSDPGSELGPRERSAKLDGRSQRAIRLSETESWTLPTP